MIIREQSTANLEEYSRISIAFQVTSILVPSLRNGGISGFDFTERSINPPFKKDYDAIPGNRPTDWQKRFDLSHWGFLIAEQDGQQVGGAAIAFQTPSVYMLEDRNDLAVLWDMRVSPKVRRCSIGSSIFVAATNWAKARGCHWLKIETQNINVPACKFYANQGAVLGAVNQFAYPAFPNETQLLWYKKLI